MIDNFENIILHLSLIDGISDLTINYLINKIGVSFEKLKKIYDFTINDFIKIGFSEKISNLLKHGLENKLILKEELNLLNKYETNFISKFNNDYSFLLNQTEIAPSILYIKTKNKIELNSSPVLAAVSSRKTNSYGKKAIDQLITLLNETNSFIISGGAIGGDSFIHEAAIKNNLKTAAIIGSGLCNPYPTSNSKLFEKILYNNGYIISPFSMNTDANKWTFPARNSIIAGMSNATLVIQAAEKSGTLITAERALQFSREVGAVPGQFNDEFSKGCHALIKSGAMLIDSSEDLFNLLSLNIKKNKFISGEKYKLEDIYLRNELLKFCFEPKLISEISEKLEKNSEKINSIIFELMTEKKICMDIMGKWVSKQ